MKKKSEKYNKIISLEKYIEVRVDCRVEIEKFWGSLLGEAGEKLRSES